MNPKIAPILAALTAAGVVIYLAVPGVGPSSTPDAGGSSLALKPKAIASFLIDTTPDPRFALPAPGSCRDYLLSFEACEDGTRCTDVYRRCVDFPDAGAPPVCDPDAGCVEVPPAPTIKELALADAEKACRKSARDVCDSEAAAGFKRADCVDRGTEACLQAAQVSGGVRWAGPSSPAAIGAKALDRIPKRQANGGCACAPNGDLFDAGGTVCKEWVTFRELDGGDWRKAEPGKVLEVYKGGQCWPVDCVETEQRAYAGAWAEGTPCIVPPDAGALPVDAGS